MIELLLLGRSHRCSEDVGSGRGQEREEHGCTTVPAPLNL